MSIEKKEEYHLTRLADGTNLILTTNSPASHYGIPALRHTGCQKCNTDFGPGDMAPDCIYHPKNKSYFGKMTIAQFLTSLLKREHLDFEEEEQMDIFLGQDPLGPQL